MLPLGTFWAGDCLTTQTPVDDPALLPACNLGYARGACPHFPPGEPADAVRFTIARDEGATIRIYYVMERDHHPHQHGALEYSRESRAILTEAPPALTRQAAAYAETYLGRIRELHATR